MAASFGGGGGGYGYGSGTNSNRSTPPHHRLTDSPVAPSSPYGPRYHHATKSSDSRGGSPFLSRGRNPNPIPFSAILAARSMNPAGAPSSSPHVSSSKTKRHRPPGGVDVTPSPGCSGPYSPQDLLQQQQGGGARTSRVRVGIRCRPPFEDEAETDSYGKRYFRSVVHITTHRLPPPPGEAATTGTSTKPPRLGAVRLLCHGTQQREFSFDFAFGPKASQDVVYQDVAAPVVQEVLNGYNGTILAYGQTGTGKTYTMGILELLQQGSTGIVPRAIRDVFDGLCQSPKVSEDGLEVEWQLTTSFLQIYRETIQDLLLPPWANQQELDPRIDQDNLHVREDPQTGFYVEGLQEYTVVDAKEALELINMGLDRRAMAPTMMNATSSRSHTVLTMTVVRSYYQTTTSTAGTTKSSKRRNRESRVCVRKSRSKLYLVDLAGSERMGRNTSSMGRRMSEAKSINSSLSALGNVIAALAEGSASTNGAPLGGRQHVPYRDSKLTRLLQDSLGGTSSTVLLGTISPATVCQSETLSTLQFASRCMHVKVLPVKHEELDYASLYIRLQEEVASMKGDFIKKSTEQQDHYENIIRSLHSQIQTLSSTTSATTTHTTTTRMTEEAAVVMQSRPVRAWPLPTMMNTSDSEAEAPTGMEGNSTSTKKERLVAQRLSPRASPAHSVGSASGSSRMRARDSLYVSYNALCSLVDRLHALLQQEAHREKELVVWLEEKQKDDEKIEETRREQCHMMSQQDPIRGLALATQLGPHLANLSRVEARKRVESHFQCSNATKALTTLAASLGSHPHPPFHALYREAEDDASAVHEYMERLQAVVDNCWPVVSKALEKQFELCRDLKNELVAQTVERRQREVEVVNWSFVLKYLLDANSNLRRKMKDTEFLPRGDHGALPVPPASQILASLHTPSIMKDDPHPIITRPAHVQTLDIHDPIESEEEDEEEEEDEKVPILLPPPASSSLVPPPLSSLPSSKEAYTKDKAKDSEGVAPAAAAAAPTAPVLMDKEIDRVLKKVWRMTEEDMASLPDEARAAVMDLRRQLQEEYHKAREKRKVTRSTGQEEEREVVKAMGRKGGEGGNEVEEGARRVPVMPVSRRPLGERWRGGDRGIMVWDGDSSEQEEDDEDEEEESGEEGGHGWIDPRLPPSSGFRPRPRGAWTTTA